jgi:hypothetical protein
MALSSGDLKDTVMPTVSIDEYEPKSGTTEEIIVVGFFCIDENPAKDLDTFLEHGSTELYDVEVSPNPNQDGYYVVFVEFKRDDSFFTNFDAVLKDVNKITGDMEWSIDPYLAERTFDYSDSTWKEYVKTSSDDYVSKSEFVSPEAVDEDILESLSDSYIDNAEINDHIMTLVGDNSAYSFKILKYLNEADMLSHIKDMPINMYSSGTERTLKTLLGEKWEVTGINDFYILHKNDNDNYLVVVSV